MTQPNPEGLTLFPLAEFQFTVLMKGVLIWLRMIT